MLKSQLIRIIIKRNCVIMILFFIPCLQFGCGVRMPAMPRYIPNAVTVPENVKVWSEETWQAAKEGENTKVISLLESPPEEVYAETSQLLERFTQLERAADLDRDEEAGNAVRLIQNRPEPLNDEWFDGIGPLADLYATGIEDYEQRNQIKLILETALQEIVAIARDTEEEHKYDEAEHAWSTALWLSEALDARDIKKTAHQKIRTMRIAHVWGDPDQDSSELDLSAISEFRCSDLIEQLVENHVSSPSWRTLAVAGFESMILRAIQHELQIRNDPNASGRHDSLSSCITSLEKLTGTFKEASLDIDCPKNQFCIDARMITQSILGQVRVLCDRYQCMNHRLLYRAFMDGVMFATDMRSRMVWPEEVEFVNRTLGREYSGIGAKIGLNLKGHKTIETMSGSPARIGGLKDEDVLISVDGVAVEDMPLNEVVNLVLGPAESIVHIEVRRNNSFETLNFDIKRSSVVHPEVLGWEQVGITDGHPDWNWLIDPDLGIAYVKLDVFRVETEIDFRLAMQEAQNQLGPNQQVEGLILDLRDNPGGSKITANRILDIFIESGTICAVQKSTGGVDLEEASAHSTRLSGMPIVVLINEHSASASELLAGALQGRANAVVIGERSLGKGSAQSYDRAWGGMVITIVAWFGVPQSDGTLHFPDRTQATGRWGIEPQLLVRSSDTQDDVSRNERTNWYSYRGDDYPDLAYTSLSNYQRLMRTQDRQLLLGIALLQAKIIGSTGELCSVSDPDDQ